MSRNRARQGSQHSYNYSERLNARKFELREHNTIKQQLYFHRDPAH